MSILAAITSFGSVKSVSRSSINGSTGLISMQGNNNAAANLDTTVTHSTTVNAAIPKPSANVSSNTNLNTVIGL
ncbi:hypothetical protein DLAC_06024 [Tieghemostelium lacteum]|uniref:Uncharacterized protein n=1 Tax=Tieghemostelium lacteum TaxID=361077 RepID=A0A151ZHA8_TIELA|nr:hypothetical protein DLAC_06024 [Tieghemostelium lacteum]|eukprot:KYQ93353.1 hypothetical protein DLAC_06024 [Tieghemostelium lacteum]